MTTEFILLLSIYALILVGVFTGESGPISAFKDSVPKLASRIEKNITTGRGFTSRQSQDGQSDAFFWE